MLHIADIHDWREMQNTLLCGDALEVMRKIPDKAIDLVLTDPPYGIREVIYRDKNRAKLAKTKKYDSKDWDRKIPERAYFEEIFRVSKNQVIFGGNYFVEFLKNSRCWLVWDKDNGDAHFADCELAWTSFDTSVRRFKYRWNGMIQQQMGRYKERRFHPTQKPLELFQWVLDNYSKPGDLILDPFAGSFTTAHACKNMGLDFICCDKEEEYCQKAEGRMRQNLLFQAA